MDCKDFAALALISPRVAIERDICDLIAKHPLKEGQACRAEFFVPGRNWMQTIQIL